MLRTVCILIATAGLLAAGFVWTLRSPDVVFLADENGAQWIRHDEPVGLRARALRERVVGFGKVLEVGEGPQPAVLSVRALRSVKVLLDGEIVFSSPPDPAAWKRRHEIDLSPWLTRGRHDLALLASNHSGPACVLAYSAVLGIRTGPD